jgi:hypothetical protein
MNTLSSAIEWFLGHCANHRKLSPHTLKAYGYSILGLRGTNSHYHKCHTFQNSSLDPFYDAFSFRAKGGMAWRPARRRRKS